MDFHCNTDVNIINENVKYACSLGLETIKPSRDHSGHICLVGGGPWLGDSLEELVKMKALGYQIWAMNNTHDWLISKSVIPDVCVLLDARINNVEFVKNPRDDIIYYVASQCHPNIFHALSDKKVIIYHKATEGVQALLETISDDLHIELFGGGTTVGMTSLVLARFLGCKNFHLYGMDSCYRFGKGHEYPQKDNETIINVSVDDNTFQCSQWMIKQADDYIQTATLLYKDGCSMSVFGNGMISYIDETMMNFIPVEYKQEDNLCLIKS